MSNTPIASKQKVTFRLDDLGDVEAIAPDGRVLFGIHRGKDANSIEVSGIEVCRIEGELYGTRLELRPIVANVIKISAVRYDE